MSSFWLNPLQDSNSLLTIPFFTEKPTRALRQADTKKNIEGRRKGSNTQHPPPGVFANSSQQRVGNEGDQNAKDNIELEHPGETPPVFRRSNFGNIKWCHYRGNSDSQSANHASNDENSNIRRQP